MKILVTGVNGQLGEQIVNICPPEYSLLKTTRDDLDLSNPEVCYEYILDNKPNWIINAGAYTAVDKAESEKDTAFKVNSEAPKAFSEALKKTGGKMLQLSTDFIFGGNSTNFYKIDDIPNPINYYGFSKLCGEKNALSNPKNIVLRTSWVYGKSGKNFLNTILSLNDKMISTDNNLKIVTDQIGCPTSVNSLAIICWKLIEKCSFTDNYPSIFHWRNSGVISWFDFADAIIEIAYKYKIISKKARLVPISTAEYPCPAVRPKYSVLDTSSTIEFLKIENKYWRTELEKIIESYS